MKIIVINGTAESGKDTFVKMVQNHSSEEVFNISSIDPVKELMVKCGWSRQDKSDEARACMAQIKAILVDRLDGPFWYVNQKIDEIRYFSPDAIVFVHVREPKEIEKLKWAYGADCTTLLVEKKVLRIPNNAADRNVHQFEYEIYISNNGSLVDLDLQALSFTTFLEEKFEMAKAA